MQPHIPQVLHHNMSYNRDRSSKLTGLVSNKTISDFALSPFAGFVSKRERSWLIKIQQLQCQGCGNPYEDDFYYTVCIMFYLNFFFLFADEQCQTRTITSRILKKIYFHLMRDESLASSIIFTIHEIVIVCSVSHISILKFIFLYNVVFDSHKHVCTYSAIDLYFFVCAKEYFGCLFS